MMKFLSILTIFSLVLSSFATQKPHKFIKYMLDGTCKKVYETSDYIIYKTISAKCATTSNYEPITKKTLRNPTLTFSFKKTKKDAVNNLENDTAEEAYAELKKFTSKKSKEDAVNNLENGTAKEAYAELKKFTSKYWELYYANDNDNLKELILIKTSQKTINPFIDFFLKSPKAE